MNFSKINIPANVPFDLCQAHLFFVEINCDEARYPLSSLILLAERKFNMHDN